MLVVHEWWGHNEYTREQARQLAELGYSALAVDMYGEGKHAEHPEDAQKFMMEVMGNMDVAVPRPLVATHPASRYDRSTDTKGETAWLTAIPTRSIS